MGSEKPVLMECSPTVEESRHLALEATGSTPCFAVTSAALEEVAEDWLTCLGSVPVQLAEWVITFHQTLCFVPRVVEIWNPKYYCDLHSDAEAKGFRSCIHHLCLCGREVLLVEITSWMAPTSQTYNLNQFQARP